MFSKPALFLDRFFVALERNNRPQRPECCIRLVIEGSGEIEESQLRAAVARASMAHPGSRLLLRRGRWVASDRPVPVRVIDYAGATDLRSDKLVCGYDFLHGPTCAVQLVRRPATRLMICAHHSVMDGRGVMSFAEDVFRCLRGESPVGADDPIVYTDLAAPAAQPLQINRPSPAPLPVLPPATREEGYISMRRSVRGPVPRVLPTVLHALAARTFILSPNQTHCCFLVPADLRAASKGVVSTGNLASALQIEVRRGEGPRTIAERIRRRLQDGEPASLIWRQSWQMWLLNRLPVTALRGFLGLLRWLRRRGLLGYMYTASVSNLGRMPVADYRAGAFVAETSFCIPPAMSTAAILLMLAGNGDNVEVTLTASRASADSEQLSALLDSIEDALTGEFCSVEGRVGGVEDSSPTITSRAS